MTAHRERKPLADMTPAEMRQAMRQQPHPYTPGDLGLCDTCAAGRVFWVHRPTRERAA